MIKIKVTALAIVSIMILVLNACSPKPASTSTLSPKSAGPVAATPGSPALEPGEKEWKELVNAARKEGKLILYATIGGETGAALKQAFEGKFGINLEQVSGPGGALSRKILSERSGGIHLIDVLVAGTTTSITTLKPVGALDPLQPFLMLPDLTDPEQIKKVWYGEKLNWVDREQKYILAFSAFVAGTMAVNTDLVKLDEFKFYNDMLKPQWTGKIAMHDPTMPGNGQMWFQVFGSKILGLDYMRELAKQKLIIMKDQRQLVDWLAHGKVAIAIAPTPEVVMEFVRVGAPVQPIQLSEGAYVAAGAGSVALLNRAPHPNAAKLFINWLLSKEGGLVFSKSYGSQSARMDVPTDFLPSAYVRKPGVSYFDNRNEEFLLATEEFTKNAKEIFSSLLQ